MVSGNLHLPGQRQHVRRKSRGGEDGGVDAPGAGILLGLFEPGRQVFQVVGIGTGGSLVDIATHCCVLTQSPSRGLCQE